MLTVSMDIPMSLGVEEYEDIRAKFAAPPYDNCQPPCVSNVSTVIPMVS